MARLFFVALMVTVLSTDTQAGVLTNGALTVILRSNGAIDSAVFSGTNFFKPGSGTDVSNFGLQNGLDASTFLLNRTNGLTGMLLSESGYTYSGSHSWSSSLNFDYLRTYSLVAGQNALRVKTTIANRGSDSFTASHFDTFDPDQAYPVVPGPVQASFQTHNDVFQLSGGLVGQASIDINGSQLTVLVGSLDSRAVVASGNPLQIGSGKDLNKFFQSPIDANGLLADKGTHIGFRQALSTNESTTFTYIRAFGANPNAAQQAFTNSQTPTQGAINAVPEPGSMVVFGAVALGGFFFRRKATRVSR
jgi:hypothetical protein